MKSTHAERVSLPIRELPPAESCAGTITFRARWQTAVETLSGYALQKLRLESAPPLPEFLLTSTHASNDNDCRIDILRPSHLPFSA